MIEFNGKPVTSMRALPQLVADTPPGERRRRDGDPRRQGVKLKVEVGLLDEEVVAAAGAETEAPAEDGPRRRGRRWKAPRRCSA